MPVSSCRSSRTIKPVHRRQFISAPFVSRALERPALLVPQGGPFGASKGLNWYKPHTHGIFLVHERLQNISCHVFTFCMFVPLDRLVVQVRYHEMNGERV